MAEPGSTRVAARPSARRAALTKARILDAAAAAFCELGYRRMRLEDVAARAGVSRALVYNYFHTKETLLQRVRDRALAGWRAAVETQIARAGGAGEKLATMVRHTLLYARERPFLQAILSDDVRAVVLGPDLSTRSAIDAWRDRLAEVLRAGIAAGEIRADMDVMHTAEALRAMQMGIIDRMHSRDSAMPTNDIAHVDAAVALIVRGVLR